LRPADSGSAAERPAHQRAEPPAEQGGEADLNDRAGNGDAAHRQQVLQRKMQADAEHQ
jgi:hypothetical protein